jgi:rubrerythrin
MAIDRISLDRTLARHLDALARTSRPLRYRLGDAFLPEGTAPPSDARLRCCTCGFSADASVAATACPLCDGHAWELLPTVAVRAER